MNPTFYSALVHMHSVGRWIVLLLLIIAIFNHITAGRRAFTKSDSRIEMQNTFVLHDYITPYAEVLSIYRVCLHDI